MVSIVQSGPEYEIRFPYNEALVSMVKQVPGRRWHPEDKFWSVPKDKIGFFLNLISDTSFASNVNIQSDEDINVNSSIDDTPRYSIPDIDISDVRTYVKSGSHLFKHQEDCLKYSIGRKEQGNFSGFLLADEMGCIWGEETVHIRVSGKEQDVKLRTLFDMSRVDYQFHVEILTCVAGFKYLPVRCVFDKGMKECVRVELSSGSTLTCTPDHEIMTDRGWTRADKLMESKLCYVRSTNESVGRWDLVLSVEPCGKFHVYDVGIDDPIVHNFVCGTTVVHNCGKTLEAINLALFKKQYEEAKHCLVICCVNSAKYNWAEDISLHTNGEYEGYIIGSRYQKRKGTVNLNGTGKQKLEDLETGLMYSDRKLGKPLPYFLIINIEAFRTTNPKLKKSERNVITRRLAEMCIDGDISMIVLDEIHRNASPQSEQGNQILRLKAMTGKRIEWIPMTGTPVVNKPTDVFLPMRLVDATSCDSYYLWNKHYCLYGGYGGHNIIGYRNIPELKSILEPNMLRRTKGQVLDLPEKVHHVEYVENTKTQQRLYGEVLTSLKSNIDEIRKSVNPLGQLVKLREVNGCPEVIDNTIDVRDKTYTSVNAKIGRLIELVQDITSNGEKVVVFSNWIAPLRSAYRWLHKKGFNVVSYVGTMSQEEREQSKHTFVNDPSCQVILGTIGALGTSHTLSVASNVIFLDESWTPASQEQAEDRCHRLDSKSTVNIYSIITKDTVDEKVHNILQRKKATADYIVDNQLDLRNNPELLTYLLS